MNIRIRHLIDCLQVLEENQTEYAKMLRKVNKRNPAIAVAEFRAKTYRAARLELENDRDLHQDDILLCIE